MAAFASARVMDRAASRRVTSVSRTRLIVTAAATAVPSQFKTVSPVGDRVIVKVDKEETKTAGGLLLPSSATKKPTAGKVIGAGSVYLVKVGDRVVYSKYAGTELKVGEDEHVLLKEEDCIGILPADDKISKLKPVGDRVLIKQAKNVDKTAGGVLLASSSESEKPNFGTVVAVGDGKKKEDSEEIVQPSVKVGSTVMYSKYAGTEYTDSDETEYIVVREQEILASLA